MPKRLLRIFLFSINLFPHKKTNSFFGESCKPSAKSCPYQITRGKKNLHLHEKCIQNKKNKIIIKQDCRIVQNFGGGGHCTYVKMGFTRTFLVNRL